MNATLRGLLAVFCCGVLAGPVLAQVELKGLGSTIKVGPDKGAGGDVDIDLPGVKIKSGGADAPPVASSRLSGPVIDVPPPAEGPYIGVPARATVVKTYRIGIAGGDVSPELRLHLGLDGVGVMVRDVSAGSPAAKAGVEKFDILVSADGAPLATINDLIGVVLTSGAQQKPIAIELLRRGKSITVEVTPEGDEVPAPVAPPQPGLGFDELNGPAGQPFNFRMFGPGTPIGLPGPGRFGGNATVIANGVSVQVQTQNGQSTVTAKKGDQTWQFDANDQESIAKLPPDVRQMVEGVTAGGGGFGGVQINADEMIKEFGPMLQGWFERRGERRGGGQGLQERLEAMEQRMLEMQRRMLGGAAGAPAPAAVGEAPAFDGGEAPVFEPGDAAAPVEIEIPAEAE